MKETVDGGEERRVDARESRKLWELADLAGALRSFPRLYYSGPPHPHNFHV